MKEEKEIKRCEGSCVEVSNKIPINRVHHAGTITHVCRLNDGSHTTCICVCDYRWTKNFK